MIESFLGLLRKRRRVDGEPETTTPSSANTRRTATTTQLRSESQSQSPPPHPSSYSMLNDDECLLQMQLNDSDSDLVQLRSPNSRQLALIDSFQLNTNPWYSSAQSYYNQPQERFRAPPYSAEAMEIDSAPVPPPQEYSDSPSFQQQHSESSMNFDYLSGLNSNAPPATGTAGGYNSSGGVGGGMDNIGAGYSRKGTDSYAFVDDRAVDRTFNLNERFVGVLDQLDARVEKFRKDAMGLQEKRDFLLMSIDLIKTNDLLHGMNEAEREEISCYIQRVNSRLSTVELNVRTVRDNSQEDSLSQINMLIDMMITLGDPVLSRQRCQQYLNACSSSDGSNNMGSFSEHGIGQDVIVDKKFECALLGCTLDDQKNVKKRLQALMGYLNKQTIRG